MSEPHFDFEREAMAEGRRWVAGIDEVGRGPLAGPVGVAAVILNPDDLPQGLDDSKAISEARRAMSRTVGALSLKPDLALIDGRDVPDGLACPARAIIGGDALSMSIAAASIIAKTTRDALMRNLGRDYPQYGFADHVGYATELHRRALALSGPCPYHRRSFRLSDAD